MVRAPRLALVLAVFTLVLIGVGTAVADPAASSPGDDWRVRAPEDPHAIEGYTSATSVAPGETLELHVSTRPAARYRVEIYRIGWYDGAGGARVGCVPDGCAQRQGTARSFGAAHPDTGELAAGWPVTDALVVPSGWRSGMYLAKLVLESGPDEGRSAHVPFVVRGDPARPSDVLVVVPVNTWQAYNAWGGLSTYSDPRSAVKVSFDRPYASSLRKPYLEHPVARFLDRYEWDVSYTTDVEIDRDRAELTRHALVVVPGHSEYWTKEMRDGFEAARGTGVNLVFLGGNTGYWQIRYADGPARRVLEEYRSAATDPTTNPRQTTVRWRDEPVLRPECSLLGNQWQGGDETSDPPGHHPYVVTEAGARHPWLAGTGLRAGDELVGAVGYEWDAIAPECDATNNRLVTLFHHEGRSTPRLPGFYTSTFHSTDADAVTYTAPSGAVVFSAGSIDFGLTLSGTAELGDPDTPPDPRAERFMRNVIDDLRR